MLLVVNQGCFWGKPPYSGRFSKSRRQSREIPSSALPATGADDKCTGKGAQTREEKALTFWGKLLLYGHNEKFVKKIRRPIRGYDSIRE
jgi:hypothetical protein